MPHREHLHTLRPASALNESVIKERYTRQRLVKDVIAGLTVGIIAIPLAMGLAVSSGVPPQHGLYTAIIAGIIAAVLGGSRLSVSGPTAAFVVILEPVAHRYGLAGLTVASLAAGLIMVLFALAKLGRLIEFIPEPVTLGFTSGIAISIAVLQLPDFFGLHVKLPEAFVGKAVALFGAARTLDWPTLVVGATTLAVLIVWPKAKIKLPPHLPAVLVGIGVSLVLARLGHPVATIGSRFSFLLPGGRLGHGIPSSLPHFALPWNLPGPTGHPLVWSFETVRSLLTTAFSIAMLGAIESLLCAVVLDGMTGRRHHANGELLGQGIANIVSPFFGGITSTAAIARSAANWRAGAESPIAAVVHALVVLAAIVALAPALAFMPMATMAALLLRVAWNMSEARKAVALVRKAPLGDVLVLLVCLSLTVLLDMVVAITVGVVLASLLFMRDVSRLTVVRDLGDNRKHVPQPLPEGWAAIKLDGPLFFAAAERVFSELTAMVAGRRGVILYMDSVRIIDAEGLSTLSRFIEACAAKHVELVVADLQSQPIETLVRAGMQPVPGSLCFTPTLGAALDYVAGRCADGALCPLDLRELQAAG